MTGSQYQDSYIKTESTAFFLLILSRGSGCVLFSMTMNDRRIALFDRTRKSGGAFWPV
ncbi:hypothetical protein HMPREF1508_1833 [Shuttleworthella sp. MSX8B]|nr:hypothetical protein HMPREF1508_1833 [Shuttleworthia sp. MSX8B]